ncbi:hypothetical protein BDZ91DRAFT_767140 [Kalaharituber pfeilii]|nr:hypothetical protein BDZ91DRAFT_767140 [Kalaharituber pfeilii]
MSLIYTIAFRVRDGTLTLKKLASIPGTGLRWFPFAGCKTNPDSIRPCHLPSKLTRTSSLEGGQQTMVVGAETCQDIRVVKTGKMLYLDLILQGHVRYYGLGLLWSMHLWEVEMGGLFQHFYPKDFSLKMPPQIGGLMIIPGLRFMCLQL